MPKARMNAQIIRIKMLTRYEVSLPGPGNDMPCYNMATLPSAQTSAGRRRRF
jgi:hypothetical protein